MSKRFISISMIFAMLLMLTFSGCQSSSSPNGSASGSTSKSTASEKFTIKTSLQASELTDEQIKEYETANPNITVERVTADDSKLMAMLAAGNCVDVIRTTGLSTVPSYVTRSLLLPLDSYVEKSTKIKESDFAAVQKIYEFDGTNQGTGHIYGFAKDWSVDTSIFINKKLFKAANVDVPSADTALTSSELAALAKKLTQKANGKVSVFGWVVPIATSQIEVNLASLGKSLWSDDLKTSKFSSAEVKSILQYYVDLAKEGYIASDANPTADGWGGTDFMADKIAMFQVGYWYSGMLRANDKIKDRLSDFVMIPSMSWDGGKAIPACTGGTGCCVYSKTKNPDAVWNFMEWYFIGEPATTRAKSGYGIASFKSLQSLMPSTTDWDKTLNAVNEKEMASVDLSEIKTNKYCSETSSDAIITKYLDPVLYGKATLDEATASMDKDVADVISSGMDIAGD
jgi:multiple sugar transport system substrate-binding protein